MIKVRGDILSFKDADAICFTSNGIVKSNGELTMGAGCAKAFRDRFPNIARAAGVHVKTFGNVPAVVGVDKSNGSNRCIVNFPTKNHWKAPADMDLIRQSAKKLVAIADRAGWKKVYLNFPGVGLGQLPKELVQEIIEPIFDDRFYIVSL